MWEQLSRGPPLLKFQLGLMAWLNSGRGPLQAFRYTLWRMMCRRAVGFIGAPLLVVGTRHKFPPEWSPLNTEAFFSPVASQNGESGSSGLTDVILWTWLRGWVNIGGESYFKPLQVRRDHSLVESEWV